MRKNREHKEMKEPRGRFDPHECNLLDPKNDPELREYMAMSWLPSRPRKRKKYRADALWHWMVPPFAYSPIPSSKPLLALWAWEERKQFPPSR